MVQTGLTSGQLDGFYLGEVINRDAASCNASTAKNAWNQTRGKKFLLARLHVSAE